MSLLEGPDNDLPFIANQPGSKIYVELSAQVLFYAFKILEGYLFYFGWVD